MEEILNGELSRYDMKDITFRRLRLNYIIFEEEYAEKLPNSFLCRILINYMSYAQDNFIDGFERDVLRILPERPRYEYCHSDRVSVTKPLAEKMSEFDFTTHESFRKRPVITYILECFAALHLAERETVYCYPQYKAILGAINDSEVLLVTLSTGSEYEVRPYSIGTDENSGSYYLAGYSRRKGSDDGFECHSFKLSRIKQCRSRHREFSLTLQEIRNASDINEKFGQAYMIGSLTKRDIGESVVRLTEYGYKTLFLKIISHQRPLPVSKPVCAEINGTAYYELRFDCSYYQILNYFFSFGSNAEVISPQPLREMFVKKYRQALQRYGEMNSELSEKDGKSERSD